MNNVSQIIVFVPATLKISLKEKALKERLSMVYIIRELIRLWVSGEIVLKKKGEKNV